MSEWIPTPHSDPANGRWPPDDQTKYLWQKDDGSRQIDFATERVFNAGMSRSSARYRWGADFIAWQRLPEPYVPPKAKSEVDRLRDEFAANFKAGMDFNDIANLFPDYIKKLCRAIIAEGKA